MSQIDKLNENISLIEMLFKTDEFQSLKDEIVKDSFRTMLKYLQYQNEKLNQIEINLYNKITRQEFNEVLKSKVSYSELISKFNENEIQFSPNYSNNIILNSLSQDIHNLKSQFSSLSQKIDNCVTSRCISDENTNYDWKSMINKNDKDLTNFIIDVQKKFIKYDDMINEIKMSQINKKDIFSEIEKAIDIKTNYNMKILDDKISNYKKELSEQVINENKEKFDNNNKENLVNKNNIINNSIDLNEIKCKYDSINSFLLDLNKKYHDKADKEDIINIYNSMEKIKNEIVNNKHEINNKINNIINDENNLKNDYNKLTNLITKVENDNKKLNNNLKENNEFISSMKNDISLLQKNVESQSQNLSIINSLDTSMNSNSNLKNMNYEISYLKNFVNKFMLDAKNEQQKIINNISKIINKSIIPEDFSKKYGDLIEEMKNKVDYKLYNEKMKIQDNINNLLTNNLITAKWKSNFIEKNIIIWDEQISNNFPTLFLNNRNNVIIKQKGFYLIKIIILNEINKNNAINLQIIINGNTIYNCAQNNMNKLFLGGKINKFGNNFLSADLIVEECVNINEVSRIEVKTENLTYSSGELNAILIINSI